MSISASIALVACGAQKWKCNHSGTLHASPRDCGAPWKGGTWVEVADKDAQAQPQAEQTFADQLWAERSPAVRGLKIAMGAVSTMQVLADANVQYGPGKDQVDCSRFVAAILVNVGIKLDDESFDAIQMTDLAGTTKAAKDARDVAVSGELDESRGVQRALVDIAKVADAVEAKNLQTGDLVQIWNKVGDDWVGHTGVVSLTKADSDGGIKFRLASPSKSKSEDVGFAASSDDEWRSSKCGTETRKCYGARLKKRSE